MTAYPHGFTADLRTSDDGHVATTIRRWEQAAIAEHDLPALLLVFCGQSRGAGS